MFSYEAKYRSNIIGISSVVRIKEVNPEPYCNPSLKDENKVKLT